MTDPHADADLADLAELSDAELDLVFAAADGAIAAAIAAFPVPMTTRPPHEESR